MRRVPTQSDHIGRDRFPAGTISWEEHVEAWEGYSRRHGKDQSADRIVERGGFSMFELLVYLGRLPTTWEKGREK